MRLYEKGEKLVVNVEGKEEIGTVVERYDEPYRLPEGQALGGAPGATHGGHAHYRVKTKDGEIHEVRDQDVRTPTKDSGLYTPYQTPEQKKEYTERKAANRARAAAEKEPPAKKTKKR